jgi:oligosaccharide repeat unit polymerase
MLYALGPLFYKNTFSDNTVNIYLTLQFLGLVGLIIGLNLPNKTMNGRLATSEELNNHLLRQTAVVFVILSLVSSFSELLSFGGISGFLAVGYGGDRFLLLSNSFMIGGGFQWLILAGIITWYYGLKASSKKTKFLGLVIVGTNALVFTLIGGRSTLVYSAIFAGVIYYYEKKTINNKLLVVLLAIGISVAQLYSNARYYLPLGLGATIRSTFAIFMNSPESFVPLPTNINEFRVPARSLLELIEYGKGDHLFGSSYLTAVGSFLPFINRIFVSLGVNPSLWHMQQYYPDILARGGGVGFSPVSEAYMNFGALGVILHMYFYGRIINKIFLNYKHKRNVRSLLLYAGALPIFALDGLRINLSSMLYKLVRIYLMPYILYSLVFLFSRQLLKAKGLVTRTTGVSTGCRF